MGARRAGGGGFWDGRACVGTNEKREGTKQRSEARSFFFFSFASVPLDGIKSEVTFQIACFRLCALACPEALVALTWTFVSCSLAPLDRLSNLSLPLPFVLSISFNSPPTFFCDLASRGAIRRRGFLRVTERSGAAPTRTGECSWTGRRRRQVRKEQRVNQRTNEKGKSVKRERMERTAQWTQQSDH